ncbi:MAG: hypothetical protein EA360_10340 [Balneolaceae bacterium]|nr:MAG: hypothetical protein EA360_10340 [Balneolaceae bacterium]
MLHYQTFFSLSDAATALAGALDRFHPADPLKPQTIIVPNMDAARWIKLRLAEISGTAANLQTELPSGWQYSLIRKLYPDLPNLLPSDLLPLTWSLFEQLTTPDLLRRYPPLEQYLKRQNVNSGETPAWQLASRIASVLDQYMVYRPGLLLGWQEGKQGSSTDEAWQADLWRDLNRRWKQLPDPLLHKNRAELQRELSIALEKGTLRPEEPLFLFHPGLLPETLLQTLRLCAEHQEVIVIPISSFGEAVTHGGPVLNPLIDSLGRETMDLEDLYSRVLGPPATAPFVIEPDGDDSEPDDPNAAPGTTPVSRHVTTQTSALQNNPDSVSSTPPGNDPDTDPATAVTSADRTTPNSVAPTSPGTAQNSIPANDSRGSLKATPVAESTSALKRIQRAIRLNQPFPDERPDPSRGRPGMVADSSVRIHSCHSPLREVETLYHSLLELFEQDPSLAPEDVLVTTPNPALYEPFIRAVFGTREEGLPEIPWHLASLRTVENEAETALRRWLELPDSRFHLQPVLDLFSMKAIHRNAGVSLSALSEIVRWMDENHVIWGVDATHREQEGQPPEELQTWHSALKRIWLGQWMADEAGLFYQDTLLYPGIRSAGQREAWAAFSRWLDRLTLDRQEAARPRSAAGWTEWIERRLTDLIGAETLQTDGAGVMNMLDRIRESGETAAAAQPVSFSLIRDLILSQLDQKGAAGALFTRGITFSSMVPVRAIPFRVIALIGLNEGTFPRREQAPDFDLMALNPLPGERNRKLEDRSLFLESILAAGEVHYVSYVGQSELDNEEIPPSPVISEWISLFIGRESHGVNPDGIRNSAESQLPLAEHSGNPNRDSETADPSHAGQSRIAGEVPGGESAVGNSEDRTPHEGLSDREEGDPEGDGKSAIGNSEDHSPQEEADTGLKPAGKEARDQAGNAASGDAWGEGVRIEGLRQEVVQKEALHLFSESCFREKRVFSPLAFGTATRLALQERPPAGLIRDLSPEADEEWKQLFTAERLIRFFRNPVRDFITGRLGARLVRPEEEREEFSLNLLEKHTLFERIMSWRIGGLDEETMLKQILSSGIAPQGWAGETLVAEQFRHAETALRRLEREGIEPGFSELQITLEAGGLWLNESLPSYHGDFLLSVEASSLSGSMLIQHWIRHLLWQASSKSEEPSVLLCELKKGKPKWCRFTPAEEPERWLEKVIRLYQKGQAEPLLFFPKTLWSFVQSEHSSRAKNPMGSAIKAFEGDSNSDFSFAESDDLHVRLLLGPEPAFDRAFLDEEYLELFHELYDRVEVQG